MSELPIEIKSTAGRRLRQGHLWVYANELVRPPGSLGLAAGRASAELAKQIERFNPRFVSTCSEECLDSKAEQIAGEDAAEELVRRAHEVVGVDLVVGAIVGSAGLGATLAAVELGIDVALANKETLVAAGELVVAACSRTGARLLPVDSEHSALWQCLGEVRPPIATPSRVRIAPIQSAAQERS